MDSCMKCFKVQWFCFKCRLLAVRETSRPLFCFERVCVAQTCTSSHCRYSRTENVTRIISTSNFILGPICHRFRCFQSKENAEFHLVSICHQVSDPGAFKLAHLQPVKPILFPKFSNICIFILGSPILITPQREKGGKWEIGILPTWQEAGDFWA